jgi:sec-independent protein translocase protein TatA
MYSSTFLFMNLGTPEILVIMFVVLLLFGGKKLPELARGLGKGIREFKDASDGVKREIHNNINSINNENDNIDLNGPYSKSETIKPEEDSTATEDPKPQIK